MNQENTVLVSRKMKNLFIKTFKERETHFKNQLEQREIIRSYLGQKMMIASSASDNSSQRPISAVPRCFIDEPDFFECPCSFSLAQMKPKFEDFSGWRVYHHFKGQRVVGHKIRAEEALENSIISV